MSLGIRLFYYGPCMYIDDMIHAIFYIINVDDLATQGANPLPWD